MNEQPWGPALACTSILVRVVIRLVIAKVDLQAVRLFLGHVSFRIIHAQAAFPRQLYTTPTVLLERVYEACIRAHACTCDYDCE